jgi:hypothetical protein
MDVLSQSCQMRCRVELGRVRLRHISSNVGQRLQHMSHSKAQIALKRNPISRSVFVEEVFILWSMGCRVGLTTRGHVIINWTSLQKQPHYVNSVLLLRFSLQKEWERESIYLISDLSFLACGRLFPPPAFITSHLKAPPRPSSKYPLIFPSMKEG